MTFINDYWTQLSALLGLIVWIVRLEAKVKETSRKYSVLDRKQQKLEAKQDTTLNYLQVELSIVKQSLAKIEGWLAGANKDQLK